jgi:hypothetical protein
MRQFYWRMVSALSTCKNQLGHARIEVTVSTYGRRLTKKAPGALDRLDAIAMDDAQSLVVSEAVAKW